MLQRVFSNRYPNERDLRLGDSKGENAILDGHTAVLELNGVVAWFLHLVLDGEGAVIVLHHLAVYVLLNLALCLRLCLSPSLADDLRCARGKRLSALSDRLITLRL